MSLRNDPDRRKKFLEVVAATGNLREAARQASPHSNSPHGCLTTFKNFMRDSGEFAAAVQESLDEFRESLVAEAVRRGRDGYDRPVFQKGKLVGHERVYSDNLLLAELRKHDPAAYSQKYDVRHDHTVRVFDEAAWTISAPDLACLSEEQRDQLRQIMVTVRDGRRERNAIEHQSAEVVEVEYKEVTEPPLEPWELDYEGDQE